jgi:GT2 family glycosyltransferase
MNENPGLSIVIVNSDGRMDTMNCLESIRNAGIGLRYEVILVDNVSEEQIFPEVRSKFPGVIEVQGPARQGFAKNYNLGIARAAGEYVMILNNDTLVQVGAIDKLIEFLEERPGFGMAGPLLRSESGQPQPVSARKIMTFGDFVLEQLFFDLGMPLGKLRAWIQSRVLNRRVSGPVECISGACMLVRRAALEDVGYLDERYDFYFEDMEWCRRFQMEGYKIGYVAEAKVVHLGDRALSNARFWAKQSEFRGAVQFFFDEGKPDRSRLALLRWVVLAGYLMRAIAFSAAGRFLSRRNQAAVYWKLLDWLKGVSVVDLAAVAAGVG